MRELDVNAHIRQSLRESLALIPSCTLPPFADLCCDALIGPFVHKLNVAMCSVNRGRLRIARELPRVRVAFRRFSVILVVEDRLGLVKCD